jgi:hypothetical protein
VPTKSFQQGSDLSDGLLAEKRDWLVKAVEVLKRDHRLTQREIAARVEDREQEFTDRLKGRRGIPDKWVDRFESEFRAFGLQFKKADVQPSTAHEEELAGMVEQLLSVVSRLSDRLDLQTNLINSLCDAVRSNGKDLQALREALVEAKPEHR